MKDWIQMSHNLYSLRPFISTIAEASIIFGSQIPVLTYSQDYGMQGFPWANKETSTKKTHLSTFVRFEIRYRTEKMKGEILG